MSAHWGLERLESRAMLSAGFIDPSFGVGGGGFASASIPPSHISWSGLASTSYESAGFIVNANRVLTDIHQTPQSTSGFDTTLVARFAAGGGLDAGYAPKLMDLIARDLLAMPDGQVIVLSKFAITRLSPSGNVDQIIGLNMPVFGGFQFEPTQMLSLADGRIVITGGYGGWNGKHVPPNWPVAVLLNPDGSRATDVGVGGVLYVRARYAQGMAVGEQPNGKLIICTYQNGVPSIYRFNSDGTVDPGFGRSGRAHLPTRVQSFDASILVLRDGKIVAGVNSLPGPGLYRLDPQGRLDPGFGDGGVVYAQGLTRIGGLLLQPDGKLIAVGGAIARYTADGKLDRSFGTDGMWLPSLWHSWGAASAVLTPDGIVAALRRPGLQSQIRLVRLTNDSDPVTRDELKYKASVRRFPGYDGQLTATLASVPEPQSGRTGLTVTVRYSDPLGISLDSLNDSILVAGPNGFTQTATFVDAKPDPGAKVVFATYRIRAPGGRWDDAATGTYHVVLGQHSAMNLLGNSPPRQKVGAFKFSPA